MGILEKVPGLGLGFAVLPQKSHFTSLGPGFCFWETRNVEACPAFPTPLPCAGCSASSEQSQVGRVAEPSGQGGRAQWTGVGEVWTLLPAPQCALGKLQLGRGLRGSCPPSSCPPKGCAPANACLQVPGACSQSGRHACGIPRRWKHLQVMFETHQTTGSKRLILSGAPGSEVEAALRASALKQVESGSHWLKVTQQEWLGGHPVGWLPKDATEVAAALGDILCTRCSDSPVAWDLSLVSCQALADPRAGYSGLLCLCFRSGDADMYLMTSLAVTLHRTCARGSSSLCESHVPCPRYTRGEGLRPHEPPAWALPELEPMLTQCPLQGWSECGSRQPRPCSSSSRESSQQAQLVALARRYCSMTLPGNTVSTPDARRGGLGAVLPGHHPGSPPPLSCFLSLFAGVSHVNPPLPRQVV